MLPKLNVTLLKDCGTNVLEFFGKLEQEEKKKLTHSMERIRGGNATDKHFAPLGDGIYEVRAMTATKWLRVLGFIDQGTVYLTNGFAKDQDKTPKSEIDLAKRVRACHSEAKAKEKEIDDKKKTKKKRTRR